jgi:hypothetical protein
MDVEVACAAVGVLRAADGLTAGVDAADTVDDVLLPVGVTTKVYASALTSPVMVQFCAPVGGVDVLTTVQVAVVAPPLVAELIDTVYVVATPSAVNATLSAVVPAKVTVGVAMATPGMKAADAGDTVEVVLLPLGVTVKVYDVPFVRPVTVQLPDPNACERSA